MVHYSCLVLPLLILLDTLDHRIYCTHHHNLPVQFFTQQILHSWPGWGPKPPSRNLVVRAPKVGSKVAPPITKRLHQPHADSINESRGFFHEKAWENTNQREHSRTYCASTHCRLRGVDYKKQPCTTQHHSNQIYAIQCGLYELRETKRTHQPTQQALYQHSHYTGDEMDQRPGHTYQSTPHLYLTSWHTRNPKKPQDASS